MRILGLIWDLMKAIDDETQTFPSTEGGPDDDFSKECVHGDRLTIHKLIACGAEFEDAPSNRSLNHFFDPAHQSTLFPDAAPLTVLLKDPTGLVSPVPAGMPSPDGTLKDNGEVSEQDFAYRNARDYRLPLPGAHLAHAAGPGGQLGQAVSDPRSDHSPFAEHDAAAATSNRWVTLR